MAEIPVSELCLYKDKTAFNDLMKGLEKAKENQISQLDINGL